ncbi:putative 5-hydroxytryptamine receptor 3A-like [Triplophysa rosa]|uniref:5-hydroxytryptamine receptor 3A-like n=1 Tax=Triplophysa rosa TaxID=992332 RepID=A0A9W7W8R0_TRIRA|nr:putative 5-hydroxytryptamine receptor 3A-like [Triplophysa rosa]
MSTDHCLTEIKSMVVTLCSFQVISMAHGFFYFYKCLNNLLKNIKSSVPVAGFADFQSLSFFWNIEGLSWDPVECGTDRISLPRQSLWMPDVVINEFMDENRAPDTYYLYVTNTGIAMDDLPIRVTSSCNLNIYTFPFDIQNCTFTFNSYKLYVEDIHMFFAEPVDITLRNSLDVMTTKGEWELINMLSEKNVLPVESMNTSFDLLIYHIILRRRPTMYIVNLLIPSCFLIGVDLFSFLLPPQNMDRSAFKMTLILGYTVFLLLMNDLLPATGNTLPLINAFFSLCLAMMVGSLLETILITNILCGSSRYPPLPQWVKVLFLNYIARLVCLSKSDQNCDLQGESNHRKLHELIKTVLCNPAKILESEAIHKIPPTLQELKKISRDLQSIVQQVEKHFSSDQSEEEWVHLGHVIDRLLFILYVVFLSVSFITIFVYWFYWYNVTASLV